MTDDAVRIAMWSGPRNLSTALMTPPDDPPAMMASVRARRRQPTTQSKSGTLMNRCTPFAGVSGGRIADPRPGISLWCLVLEKIWLPSASTAMTLVG